DHATRIVELHRNDFTYPDTVKIDTGSVAQTCGRAFENDVHGAAQFGGVQALKPQHESERGGDHGERERSDQNVVRPRFHYPTPRPTKTSPRGKREGKREAKEAAKNTF